MGFLANTMLVLLMLTGALLMFIVLLQRGRGGGLAGAFGGAGGQSAFGTKAGDVFTKITVVIAVVWVLLAGTSGLAIRSAGVSRFRANEVSVMVTFGEQSERFTFLKQSSVGAAAAEAAERFELDAERPTLVDESGEELDPDLPLETAGIGDRDQLTLIEEAAEPETPSPGDFGEDGGFGLGAPPGDEPGADALPEDLLPGEPTEETPERPAPTDDAATPDEEKPASEDDADAPLEEEKPGSESEPTEKAESSEGAEPSDAPGPADPRDDASLETPVDDEN